jgi:hypothetical protein
VASWAKAAIKNGLTPRFSNVEQGQADRRDEVVHRRGQATSQRCQGISVVSETSRTSTSQDPGQAFEEITGIKVKHDLDPGDDVEKLQTSMQSGKSI